ncbi:hypothetical protein F442_19430 [Phytophthora nicotianae P10297]|uniref:Uncharacterized protein n=1 Tax=Phytophthora nicotianae P10297 TaxID=1317064 RepID=W2Y9R8_PHYNI|nr:hypothetical protein F442_19430 [Phytophthora nicotianae P10297]
MTAYVHDDSSIDAPIGITLDGELLNTCRECHNVLVRVDTSRAFSCVEQFFLLLDNDDNDSSLSGQDVVDQLLSSRSNYSRELQRHDRPRRSSDYQFEKAMSSRSLLCGPCC